jgi:hypothetical protein
MIDILEVFWSLEGDWRGQVKTRAIIEAKRQEQTRANRTFNKLTGHRTPSKRTSYGGKEGRHYLAP